jgi:hypothetical protein
VLVCVCQLTHVVVYVACRDISSLNITGPLPSNAPFGYSAFTMCVPNPLV